ncbi:hypothetical protein BU25DRAFT_457747 [Macroventuria anomochaeta]|uniref:Uncharacterized protein n=1 Tax=Macroventuria anomochaeta TaxID=301207 RepID=A0ACB6S2P3_9PLEO|nr:uncharacterized protein BU25DRAFT_457747 [Macroventuria anomochaeta]KAF2628421.1 hypothetical protein BU25DRAFT_457747 [Macroventuria anomochaeta]
MQSCQTKLIAAPTSSPKPQPKSRAKDDANEKNRGKTTSAEDVMPQNTLGSEGSRQKEGKTAWHMEGWLNETSGEEAWSVHGRF